ncbi:hypothetical protein PR048_004045 [Dryococelus australis]|uniref:Integrase zinc-binding domain-containing protein n=1 Tax=Dryococelus australis TaxID=614101 RepID=A0ABQ9I4U2_9NEOP|nr:hypothetical protein PR048_004045 [Dryococelus australis]
MDVTTYVRSCEDCQRCKLARNTLVGLHTVENIKFYSKKMHIHRHFWVIDLDKEMKYCILILLNTFYKFLMSCISNGQRSSSLAVPTFQRATNEDIDLTTVGFNSTWTHTNPALPYLGRELTQTIRYLRGTM